MFLSVDKSPRQRFLAPLLDSFLKSQTKLGRQGIHCSIRVDGPYILGFQWSKITHLFNSVNIADILGFEIPN